MFCYWVWRLRGRDGLVVGFTTTNAISLYHPVHDELYSIQHYVIKFVSDMRQIGGFLRVLPFSPPIKLTATIYRGNWNIVESGVKYHNPKPSNILHVSPVIYYSRHVSLLLKESLNSDCHQFHQYQQTNNLLLVLLNSLNTKKPTIYGIGNQSRGLGQAQQCGGVKPINGISPSRYMYVISLSVIVFLYFLATRIPWISNILICRTYINKNKYYLCTIVIHWLYENIDIYKICCLF